MPNRRNPDAFHGGSLAPSRKITGFFMILADIGLKNIFFLLFNGGRISGIKAFMDL
jgi:hypothetical protein